MTLIRSLFFISLIFIWFGPAASHAQNIRVNQVSVDGRAITTQNAPAGWNIQQNCTGSLCPSIGNPIGHTPKIGHIPVPDVNVSDGWSQMNRFGSSLDHVNSYTQPQTTDPVESIRDELAGGPTTSNFSGSGYYPSSVAAIECSDVRRAPQNYDLTVRSSCGTATNTYSPQTYVDYQVPQSYVYTHPYASSTVACEEIRRNPASHSQSLLALCTSDYQLYRQYESHQPHRYVVRITTAKIVR